MFGDCSSSTDSFLSFKEFLELCLFFLFSINKITSTIQIPIIMIPIVIPAIPPPLKDLDSNTDSILLSTVVICCCVVCCCVVCCCVVNCC